MYIIRVFLVHRASSLLHSHFTVQHRREDFARITVRVVAVSVRRRSSIVVLPRKSSFAGEKQLDTSLYRAFVRSFVRSLVRLP